jgi:hypothetical protein
MTEDDTFNCLRRTPIQDLDAEYRIRRWEFYSAPEIFSEWLEKYGWTESEFFKSGSEYEKSQKKCSGGNSPLDIAY